MAEFESLYQKLSQNKEWPISYMFKFVVPSDMSLIARVEALFSAQAVIYRKESRSKRYVSVTATELMESAEHIVEVYRKAAQIENIIAL